MRLMVKKKKKKIVEKVTNTCQGVTEKCRLFLDFKNGPTVCVCVFMLHVPGSAGLQLSLLTVTFPPSKSPRFSHYPPSEYLSIPKSLPFCRLLLHPPPPQPPILPPSLHLCLCHPLIQPSLPQSDWMMLAVLDVEHRKGLHEYTIHHHRQGQLKPRHTHTIDFRCVCVSFQCQHIHTKYTVEPNKRENMSIRPCLYTHHT